MTGLQENKPQVVTTSQLGLIGSCAAIILALSIFKLGLPAFIFSKQEHEPKQLYTYDDARKVVLARAGNAGLDDETKKFMDSQLAMLDPMFQQGAVLGASTSTLEILDVPKFEDTISSEAVEQIPALVGKDNSLEAMVAYQEQLSDPVLQEEISVFLADINSGDNSVLQKMPQRAEQLMHSLVSIPVPQKLAEYHKLQMFYYFELGELAYAMGGAQDALEPKQTSDEIVSLSEKLNRLRSEIYNSYGIQL